MYYFLSESYFNNIIVILWILREDARYKFGHEILENDESVLKGVGIIKKRRVLVILILKFDIHFNNKNFITKNLFWLYKFFLKINKIWKVNKSKTIK